MRYINLHFTYLLTSFFCKSDVQSIEFVFALKLPEEGVVLDGGLPQSLGHVIFHLVLVRRSLLRRRLYHTHTQ